MNRRSLPSPALAALPLLVALAALARQTPALAARPAKQPRPAAGQPRASTAQPAAAPQPAAQPGPVSASGTPEELLARARSLLQQLEYEQVIPVAQALVDREEAPLPAKLEGYVLLGSCLAVVRDPVEAERPFRLLLRASPDHDLPADTAPKILAVFRKVQVEERAIAERLTAFERSKRVASLTLAGDPGTRAEGGKPIRFLLTLTDPGGAVTAVRVAYRRKGEPTFSSLALRRGEAGGWAGSIPGEWTATEPGFPLEYFLETLDGKGPLLTRGSAARPLLIEVTPGQVKAPPPLRPWAFWTGAVSTGVLGAAAGGLALATRSAQADYQAYAAQGNERAIDGAILNDKGDSGERLALATNVTLIAAGALAITSALILPFTDWDAATAARE